MQGFSPKLNINAEGTNHDTDEEVMPKVQQPKADPTPPDLENLQSNIKKLEADLHEARSRNVYLNELIETQKM